MAVTRCAGAECVFQAAGEGGDGLSGAEWLPGPTRDLGPRRR
jgi:hypothetical protein